MGKKKGDQGSLPLPETEKPAETELPPVVGGRKIAGYKDKARAALPNGTLAEQAAKANEYAEADGFALNMTADKMKPKDDGEAPTRTTGTRTRADTSEPTISEALNVKRLIEASGNSLVEIAALLSDLEKLEAAAGGADRLRAVVRFWVETLPAATK